ncbi:hypothetical protein JHK87_038316 [Glycine soja]|nr:hypothetical protein JHK87_038316 [Glycine soja]
MDKVCLNSEAVPVVPAVGMEFDSYEDVYYFYNWYANEQGFGVRFTNTWYRKTKERYRAKLSCSSAGFKKRTEANRPRPETRTGFPAMIKFRLMDSTRWRIIEILQTKRQLEALADLDSKSSSFVPKSRSYFELQVSKLYTNETLRMFEREVKGMFSCFNSRQINADGPVVTYIVQEQVEVEGNQRDARDYEVCYNEAEMEVLCICGLFNFRGCLCRHALFILSQNEIKEIPAQYILLRWRNSMKRGNVDDHNGSGIDFSNPVHRYDHLYRTGCEGCRGR